MIAASAYPAVLDPTISPEFGYDLPVIGPAVTSQTEPDLAYSGTSGAEFLAVWSDRRRESSYESDIFGARITANGTLLDPVGLQIASQNALSDQVSPAVAWAPDPDGGGFLTGTWMVVWTDVGCGGGMIRGRKVAADGDMDTPDFDVSLREGCQITQAIETEPDLAYNSAAGAAGQFLVAWRASGPTTGIQAVACDVLTPSGGCSLAQGSATTITTEVSARAPAVASDNGALGFFVTWADSRSGSLDIYGASVAGAVAPPLPVGPTRTITSNAYTQTNPAISFLSGLGFAVAWEDYRIGTGAADVYAQRIDGAGVPLGGNVAISTATNDQLAPALVAGTTSWFASWSDTRTGGAGFNDIYGTRLSVSSGALVVNEPAGISVSTAPAAQLTPSVAFDASNATFVNVWSDARTSSLYRDIFGARVSSSGALLDANGWIVSTSSNQQESPAIATCAGRYLAVWADTRNSFESPDIYGAISDVANPATILVNNIAISTAPGRQDLPDVTCAGGNFFVVWADERSGNRDVYGARVQASDGAVLDPTGIAISTQPTAESDPAAAYSGCAGKYAVTWSDRRSGNYDVYSKFVSTAGVVDHVSERNISGSVLGDQVKPDITWDSDATCSMYSGFLIVWQDGRIGGEFPDWNIWARFESASGVLTTPLQVTAASSSQQSPTVASKPNSPTKSTRLHLVAYESSSSSGITGDVVGTVITPPNANSPER